MPSDNFKLTYNSPTVWGKMSKEGKLLFFSAAECAQAAKNGDAYASFTLALLSAVAKHAYTKCTNPHNAEVLSIDIENFYFRSPHEK